MNGSGLNIDADEASWQQERALEQAGKVWDVQRLALEARIKKLEQLLDDIRKMSQGTY